MLIPESVYLPNRNFAGLVLRKFGVEVGYYPPGAGAGIASFLRENTKLVWCESPGSITMEVQNGPAIAEAAHRAGALVALGSDDMRLFTDVPLRICIEQWCASGPVSSMTAGSRYLGFERAASDHYVDGTAIASVFAALGERDSAFAWMDQALRDRSATLGWGKLQPPQFAPLRSDPRYDVLLTRIRVAMVTIPQLPARH